MSLDFQLTVFSDPQGDAAARVYVVAVPTRDVSDEELAAYRLSGLIVGPTCRYSSTLQSKIPFRHRGFTQCGYRTALVAEAIVPDPCYWSTELPFLYRAVGEVTGDVTGATSFDQTFGIRSVGTLRDRLTLNGKLWVPRCVDRRKAPSSTLAEWRDSETVMVVKDVDEGLVREASEAGVLVLACREQCGEHAAATLFQLSRHPAVVLAVIDDRRRTDPLLQTAARNTLLGRCGADEPLDGCDDATRFRLVASSHDIKKEMVTGVPSLAVRETAGTLTLVKARAMCDQTQREMAQIGQAAAGYIVI